VEDGKGMTLKIFMGAKAFPKADRENFGFEEMDVLPKRGVT
jgi:hypothetical protein